MGYDPPSVRTVFGGWIPNYTVIRGQAVFVQNSTTAFAPVKFSFSGEVPETRNGGGTTTVFVTGLDATAYPYPANIEFGQTQIAITSGVGSAVFFWNPATQSYDSPSIKSVFSGWGPAGGRVVSIGEGFFMGVAAPSVVMADEVQPYDLDN